MFSIELISGVVRKLFGSERLEQELNSSCCRIPWNIKGLLIECVLGSVKTLDSCVGFSWNHCNIKGWSVEFPLWVLLKLLQLWRVLSEPPCVPPFYAIWIPFMDSKWKPYKHSKAFKRWKVSRQNPLWVFWVKLLISRIHWKKNGSLSHKLRFHLVVRYGLIRYGLVRWAFP